MSEALDAAVEKHRRGDIAGAREAARAGLATSPDDVALLHFLGMIETRFGTRERAQELLERADKLMYEAKNERTSQIYPLSVRIQSGALVELAPGEHPA